MTLGCSWVLVWIDPNAANREVVVNIEPPNQVTGGELIFHAGDTIRGNIGIHSVAAVESISVKLLLRIELYPVCQDFVDNVCRDFVVNAISVDPLPGTENYAFEFLNAELACDTYYGEQVNVSYILNVTIDTADGRRIGNDQVFSVVNSYPASAAITPFKLKSEGPFGAIFKIEVEVDKSRYDVNDVMRGEFRFVFAKFSRGLEIRALKVELQRTATTVEVLCGRHSHHFLNLGHFSVYKTTLADIELPIDQDNIDEGGYYRSPFEIVLTNYNLTPTVLFIHDLFKVEYHLKLVLITSDRKGTYAETLDEKEMVFYCSSNNN